jgi:hypothetical protein
MLCLWLFAVSVMADQSPFKTEERLIMAVWEHERPQTGRNVKEVFQTFQRRFKKEPPTKATALAWERKLFASGSIKDSPRSGRPRTRTSRSEESLESVQRSPKKSVRKRSAELAVPKSSLHKHLQKDLQLHPYRPKLVNELSDEDMHRRIQARENLLQTFSTLPSRSKVLFTDECAIYRSSHHRNVVFWRKGKPHFYEEIENNPPHVMVWAALSAIHLIGPFFSNGFVTQHSYLDMLRQWFVPQLHVLGIDDGHWFQQDGAPRHFRPGGSRIPKSYFSRKVDWERF